MGRVRTDSNISFAQSTAMTDGPRHDQKSDAGGAGLKLVKEFICFSAIQKLRNIVYMSNKMRKFAGAKVLCHGKRREIQTVETAN
jgi:hypothetical protein